jgi:hypothetical protein
MALQESLGPSPASEGGSLAPPTNLALGTAATFRLIPKKQQIV